MAIGNYRDNREDCNVSTESWSKWVRAIIPKLPDGCMEPCYEKRSSYQTGYICTNVRQAFYDYDCGIYEWKAVHQHIHGDGELELDGYVVYIGSTCRYKPGLLQDHILEYCRNGSHKRVEFNRALRRGYEMWVRVKEIEGAEEEAEKAENDMLDTYNYAWNKRKNSPYRGKDVPPLATDLLLHYLITCFCNLLIYILTKVVKSVGGWFSASIPDPCTEGALGGNSDRDVPLESENPDSIKDKQSS